MPVNLPIQNEQISTYAETPPLYGFYEVLTPSYQNRPAIILQTSLFFSRAHFLQYLQAILDSIWAVTLIAIILSNFLSYGPILMLFLLRCWELNAFNIS